MGLSKLHGEDVAGLLCPLGSSDPVGLQLVSLGSQLSDRGRVSRAGPDMARAMMKT
jgi:hypothetical protein